MPLVFANHIRQVFSRRGPIYRNMAVKNDISPLTDYVLTVHPDRLSLTQEFETSAEKKQPICNLHIH